MAANQDDPEAQLNLGTIYYIGDFIIKDFYSFIFLCNFYCLA